MATNILPPRTNDPPVELLLEFPENRFLIELCGQFDQNLAQIEQLFSVQIVRRGNALLILGDARAAAGDLLRRLYARIEAGKPLEPGDIDAAARLADSNDTHEPQKADQIEMFGATPIEIRTRKKTIEPRTKTQQSYVRALFTHELTFGIGPAGTGKTYLAVAVAVNQLIHGYVDRIVLSRPAVEAGERLGFLPGDKEDKIAPYMQPLYDALHDFLPGKQIAKWMEDKTIEIAPLAFMRGRTLANACVVLDEAQNATQMQMKMFLTRLGQGSRMAITGDQSQVDLPRGVDSGLIEAARLLRGVEGIGFAYFNAKDVVRHPLVAKIIEAYDKNVSQT